MRGEFFRNSCKVDCDTSYSLVSAYIAQYQGFYLPCNSRDVPSGMYLIKIFRRRYSKKPYSGDFSSYCATAPRASAAPPVPRASTSTASREAYLSRNLYARH